MTGGAEGGAIVAEGTPEMVSKNEGSYTGLFLERVFSINEEDTSERKAEMKLI